jgi:hypothetical protein
VLCARASLRSTSAMKRRRSSIKPADAGNSPFSAFSSAARHAVSSVVSHASSSTYGSYPRRAGANPADLRRCFLASSKANTARIDPRRQLPSRTSLLNDPEAVLSLHHILDLVEQRMAFMFRLEQEDGSPADPPTLANRRSRLASWGRDPARCQDATRS